MPRSSMSETVAPAPPAYDRLLGELRRLELLSATGGLLSWDQETMMPPRAAGMRAEQAALLSELVHERFTSPELGELIAACEADAGLLADGAAAANVRETRRAYDRAVRLPTSLVRDLAETSSRALEAWRGSREASDFPRFAPWLEKIVALTRAKAQCLRTDAHPDEYDALLDEYEPGTTAAELERVFGALRARLVPLISAVASSGVRPERRVHELRIPPAEQKAFNERIARAIGFDFAAGRLDTSTHPFCTGLGPGDTRLTTRYREDGFPDALSSTLHEGGHGLYEQGLPKEERMGQPLAEAASVGIHESQSRMWENFVGRSRAFWEWALPEAQQAFAGLREVDVDEVYRSMNLVEPTLIRVDADEATYNLHIMLRFDLERAMLAGELPVAELPAAWNRRVRDDLGLEVPDDARGCLQDIHWSLGAIGYFPTYTLGNLYAAQLWEAARAATPDLEARIGRGDFTALLGWLRSEIHRHGRRYPAMELCERVTGRPLDPAPFVSYLEGKLAPLYRLG
jgi:carboxypeptidase Taq